MLKILWLAGIALLLALFVGEIENANSQFNNIAKAYEQHLYVEYKETMCGIESSTLIYANQAWTEKELACMNGAKERAKKEVEEAVERNG